MNTQTDGLRILSKLLLLHWEYWGYQHNIIGKILPSEELFGGKLKNYFTAELRLVTKNLSHA